jgi:hypothetical protein
VAEDGTDVEPAWISLMAEAGVSPGLRRFHMVLWFVLLLLGVALAVLVVVGFFVGGTLLVVGLALFGTAVVVMIAAYMHRQYLIAKVRWLDGTVTFRTVEPGGVGEDGQYVVCQIMLRPPTNNLTRVATTIGPLDAQHLVVGATMRCLIDRADGFKVLRVYPYAKSDTTLPSGRMLQFHKA